MVDSPPRHIDIKGQDHLLAYITPAEGELLKAYGGSGEPGPMGIPSFEGDAMPEGNIMTRGGNQYYSYQNWGMEGADDASNYIVRVGSPQDTAANRALAAQTDPNWNQGTGAIVSQTQPYVPVSYSQQSFQPTSNTGGTGSTSTGSTSTGSTGSTSNPVGVPEMTIPNVGTGANPRAVDEYMGEQSVNPLMPQQGLYLPETQTIGTDELVAGTSGQVTGQVAPATTAASATQAVGPAATAAQQYAAATMGNAPQVNTAQGTVSTDAQVQAQQGALTQQAQGAQGQIAGNINPLTGRTVTAPEQAQAATANTAFLTPYQAAQSGFVSTAQGATMQVTPNMTVEGQLARLSTQFAGGQVPSWAAGAIRNADATMAARGLSASSMAGAAITQAAMEAALPIATQDSQTYFKTAAQIMSNEQQAMLANTQNNMNVDLANTSNRQQMALAKMQVNASLAGQELSNQQQTNILNAERFAEAANMTFTQEQQRVFANSKMVETLNLSNLSNTQAAALANAATMAQMDMANLNTRQQAAVQNAQSFMQMDMANMSNAQQSAVINQQAQQQAMLSDQAAQNAAQQFNATSANQTNQFFANLTQDINKYNAAAASASSQFNAGQSNAMQQFTATMQNQREQFNAQNALAIEQSNVQWRREVNTANTAQQNAANQVNAANYLAISNTALNNVWQQFRDEADYAYSSAENAHDRAFNMAMAVLEADVNRENQDKYLDQSTASSIGSFLTTIGASYIGAKYG